ncbi:MAG: hypothetical protein MUO76_13250 [Anaerolineaceae bacterium]|nr:hypothetical protein [Anaerolineaceae bacterium]
MPTIKVHIANEDPIIGEVEALPDPKDVTLLVQNPRRRDGKELSFLEDNVSSVIWPIHKINFIQIYSGEQEDIISHVRE